ncbi:relaxase/mobilization nuclease domain-containing protein [Microvirga sp. GCM10011540]|uniref:relaxase/mobilization nuclease domain-containing protein n=1 Tax=Microvirga sp. GCM10011540 TaxID=3317338 RepID=UPI00361D3062
MISGAVRGKGGKALSAHLLKAENESVHVVEPRGLGSPDLHGQLAELVAGALGGRTDKVCYHVHADPDPGITDSQAALDRFWSLFEAEFGLTEQPYCGARHVKHSRHHEHRVYSLVRPDGGVIDLSWDYLRREMCSRIVECEFGMHPVPSKHARAIERRLREDNRHDVADWLILSGQTMTERPVADLSPEERLIQERTGIPLDEIQRKALDAWKASADGAGFVTALRERGLDLRQGRSGAVIVDATGTAHLATRVLGAASRRIDGDRIPAAAVKARLAGMTLIDHVPGEANVFTLIQSQCPTGPGPGRQDALDRRAGAAVGAAAAGERAGPGGRPADGAGRIGGGGGRPSGSPGAAALRRLQALPRASRVALAARVRAEARWIREAEHLADRLEGMRKRYAGPDDWVWTGEVSIWGVPIDRAWERKNGR